MKARGRPTVIAALGIIQILAWGSSFYLMAVLASPIAHDTGWPLPWVVGALTAGLLTAGLVSPRVGLAIGRHGGRPVLAVSALLLAAGLLTIGLAPSLVVFVAGWLVIGLGMGSGLYDAAFATLGRIYGDAARPAITTLTLWGGFASTVCWPLSAAMVEHWGWRGACLAYAAIQVCVSLPLVLLMLPAAPAIPEVARNGRAETRLKPQERRVFLLLAAILTLGGSVMGLISVHLLTLLQAKGLGLAEAVSLGALIGPSQVAARILEMAGKGRHHPIWTLTMAAALIAVGVLVLWAGYPAAALALVVYGGGQGIFSIARGTMPLALFGAARYPSLMGSLGRPNLIAQALAPSAGAFVLAYGGAGPTLAVLASLAITNVVLVGFLWREVGVAGRAVPFRLK